MKDFFETKVDQLIDEDIKTIKNQEPKTFNETKLRNTPTNLVQLIKRSISTARGDRLYKMNNLLKEVAIMKESKKDINIDIFCDIMILRFFSVYKKGEVYPSDLTVWRWVDGKTNLDYKKSENLISWPFFTITSLSEKKELKSVLNQKSGYLLKITIPKGSAFLYSEDWPSYKDVLLPPCTKIKLGKVSSPLDGEIGFTAARVLPYPEKFPDIEKFARILVLKHYYKNKIIEITPDLLKQWGIDMVKDLQLLACTPAPANPEVKKNF